MFGETVGTILVSGTSVTQYLTTHTNSTTGVITYEPTRIFHIHLVSSTSISTLKIQNGTTGLPWLVLTNGTGNKGTDFDFGVFGVGFPSGAYVTGDSNLASAAIVCKADKF